jgi:hypothetical protein
MGTTEIFDLELRGPLPAMAFDPFPCGWFNGAPLAIVRRAFISFRHCDVNEDKGA